eukprot:1138485-Pyramimonas_sp.AAC.1
MQKLVVVLLSAGLPEGPADLGWEYCTSELEQVLHKRYVGLISLNEVVDAARAFMDMSKKVVRRLTRRSKDDLLETMADELAMHHHGHDAAKEWTMMHALQKFG